MGQIISVSPSTLPLSLILCHSCGHLLTKLFLLWENSSRYRGGKLYRFCRSGTPAKGLAGKNPWLKPEVWALCECSDRNFSSDHLGWNNNQIVFCSKINMHLLFNMPVSWLQYALELRNCVFQIRTLLTLSCQTTGLVSTMFSYLSPSSLSLFLPFYLWEWINQIKASHLVVMHSYCESHNIHDLNPKRPAGCHMH